MTVRELYDFCKELGIENYSITSAGIQRGYSVTEKDIEIRFEEPEQMKGEVWI